MKRFLITVTSILLVFQVASGAGLDPSYSEDATIDTVPFFEGGEYDASVPGPNDYLKHAVGERACRYYELVPYLEAVAEASDRVILETHGTTHEGRKLYNLFISSPEQIADLESLRASMDNLADPSSGITDSELEEMYANLPAVAWLGYSIHGDELSGVDAAIQLIYQLAAGTDPQTLEILENTVIIIDPIQNPDGRERYMSMLQTYQSHVPNYNRRAMQHSGVWPWGRTNHYLFDLNRDWFALTQPETKGKTATIQKWHPQLVVDAHEMGSNDTYLFSPPRQPINYNTSGNVLKWWPSFARDQAAAFDDRGWTCYTGEWHEQWFPGYGSSWPSFFGGIAILYEQAGVDVFAVKQQDDYLLTYHEAVNKQFTSSYTNLSTLAANREEILRDYRNERESIVDRGRRNNLTFIIKTDRDELKTKRFVERLNHQGIEVSAANREFTASDAHDINGDTHKSMTFPSGTYVVSTAQVNGALAKAVLEFDPHLKQEFLEEERRELEKHSDTKMYEVSTWSAPLAYDLDAYWTTSRVNADLSRVTEVAMSTGRLIHPEAQMGFIVNMVGEKTYLCLARLFAEGVTVYTAEKPFELEGNNYEAGSLVIRKRGNRPDLTDLLAPIAEEIGIDIVGVNTGASSKGSWLGAGTFRLLTKPKVAIVAGNGTNYHSFGTLWYAIDRELEYPHSLVSLSNFQHSGLDQFNVLVLSSSWGPMSAHLGEGGKRAISDWVSDGGTLICMGQSAAWAADTATGLSQVVIRRQVLDKLDEYDVMVARERAAEKPTVDTMALYYPVKVPAEDKPDENDKGSAKITKEEDEWMRRFSPVGTLLRADLDREDWLAFGMKESVPVMVQSRFAFLAKSPVRTVGRFADINDVRLSGLLWPEARQRLANTAFLTRERKGKGQIIMFAAEPNHRAYFYGTRKLFVNALLYGPGMGTDFEGPYSEQ
ncbi:MAG: hypothetical protein JSU65_11645 [Candidatus Zixiibacteriota bacterium]|nr:MAG: hypothetical protein JSU65_11645 [candidate division Zixibacteria bacterium]